MKKPLIVVLVFIVIAILGHGQYDLPLPGVPASAEVAGDNDAVLANAFGKRVSKIQVEGRGIVVKVLPDDNEGSRHQRFIVRLGTGQRILIAHNIDLAPRVASLDEGDVISFAGEYEWNPKGGVVHWTHYDPNGRHPAGWIRRGGQIFQ